MEIDIAVKQQGKQYKFYAPRLEKLGIVTLRDFLYHVPFRYEDFSLISPIASTKPGLHVTVHGEVKEMRSDRTKSGKMLQKAIVSDESGSIEVVWFNQPFLTRSIVIGDTIALSGVVDTFLHKAVMQSPEYEIVRGSDGSGHPTIHTGRLVPIYPETAGVSSKWLRRQVWNILNRWEATFVDYLPLTMREQHQLLVLNDALRFVHFPDSFEQAVRARHRLAFDELFLLQLSSMQKRDAWKKHRKGFVFATTPHTQKIEQLLESLPFTLTNAQDRAIKDILTDVTSKNPMNRLLEGDVGSGKTVVAAVVMYLAFLNDYQSILMAPTEILANQHFATIEKLLSPLGVQVGIVTGSKKSNILNTKYQILIGTHALLSKNIAMDNLGLVVIDEQQRFGVQQRGVLRKKGKDPHLLTMTATPIPRTVALTLYGDLDLSYLDEMPKGRQIIKTWLVPEEKRTSGYAWMQKQMQETDSQAFIICPFIEESENMTTVKAATKEFARLQKDIFPKMRLGLLHGKLKSKEKDAMLASFKNKKIDILVATPVVEVGIDIPNATIMVTEAAERFGLSQLHQLRGRVGRGDKQSYCLLFTESTNPQTIRRLKAMETMHVGSTLAEYDLELRGPGDMFGTRQSGSRELKIASFGDRELISETQKEARTVFADLEDYPLIKAKLTKISSSHITPD